MHTTTLFTRVKQHSLLFLLFFPTLLSLTPLAYYTLGYPLPKLLHIPTYHLTSIHLLILCIITALLLAEHLPKIPRIAILVLYSAYVFLRWAVCGAWTWFQGMPAHIALEDRGRTVEHRVKHLEKVVVGLQIEQTRLDADLRIALARRFLPHNQGRQVDRTTAEEKRLSKELASTKQALCDAEDELASLRALERGIRSAVTSHFVRSTVRNAEPLIGRLEGSEKQGQRDLVAAEGFAERVGRARGVVREVGGRLREEGDWKDLLRERWAEGERMASSRTRSERGERTVGERTVGERTVGERTVGARSGGERAQRAAR